MEKEKIKNEIKKISLHNYYGFLSIYCLTFIDSFFLALKGELDFTISIYSSPFIFVILTIFIGIGNSKLIYLPRFLEDKCLSRKNNFIDLISLMSCTITLIFMYLNIDYILKLFNTKEELFNLSSEFIKIYYLGMLFCVFITLKSNYLKIIGNTKMAANIMICSSLLNLLLDPIFIFYFDYGAKGAAIASGLSWFLTSCLTLLILNKLKITNKIKKINLIEFLKITPSMIITQLLNPLTILITMYFINLNTIEVISGYGLGSRLERFIIIISYSISSALTLFIGKNLKDEIRIKEALIYSFFLNLKIILLSIIGIYILSETIGDFFNLKVESQIILKDYIWISILGLISLTTHIIISGYLNIKKAYNKVFLINFIKTLFILPLFLFIGNNWLGYKGIFIALSLSNLLGMIFLCVILKKTLTKNEI